MAQLVVLKSVNDVMKLGTYMVIVEERIKSDN